MITIPKKLTKKLLLTRKINLKRLSDEELSERRTKILESIFEFPDNDLISHVKEIDEEIKRRESL